MNNPSVAFTIRQNQKPEWLSVAAAAPIISKGEKNYLINNLNGESVDPKMPSKNETNDKESFE